MIYIREGSHVQTLLFLLACVGEYPIKSLHLLGSERTWKALILKLTKTQEYCLKDTGERFRCKLLTVSGKGKYKTVRLHISALVILEKLDEAAYQYYLTHFDCHHFSGNQYHIDRHHRIAEAFAMFLQAGALVWPHKLPDPNSRAVRGNQVSEPMFFLSRDLKEIWGHEMNKTKFSRLVGATVYPGDCYTVFNSRDALMKWSGNGESKARDYLSIAFAGEIPAGQITSAVLFGQDYLVALRTLEEAARRRRYDLRFDNVYRHIHFIPMNAFGIKQLKTITMENWHDWHRYMLYEEEEMADIYRPIEYDAIIDGRYCLSHLDGDLCRLIRVKDALRQRPEVQYEIICYPEQLSMVKEYMNEFRGKSRLSFSTVTIDRACEYLFQP